MRPIFAVPPDVLGKFQWALLWFLTLNCLAFAGLAVFGPAPILNGLGAALALLAAIALCLDAYRRKGPTVVHDLVVVVLLGLSTGGFSKVSMVQSLMFAWVTWVQLFGGALRSLLRVVLIEAMWFAVFALVEGTTGLGNQAGQIIGVTMASFFSFALGTALARVQASEARFRALVQNASDLIVVVNPSGELKYLSPPSEQAFGIARGLLQSLAHPDDAAALSAALLRGSGSATARLKLKGEWRDCEALISNQVNNPDVGGLVLNVRDVSERKAADAALRAQEVLLRDSRHEVEIAARIQTALLPPAQKLKGLEIAATMRPASEVGGDYYDILEVEDGVVIGVGDVAGHGLAAGLIMLMTQSVVSALVRSNPRASPKEIVVHLNHVLHQNIRDRLNANEHVTFTLVKVARDGTVTHAGAHEELFVWRARTRSVEAIPTRGTWLGGMRDVSAATVESKLKLEPGDVLLLHTDGITEARNDAKEEYGTERLTAHLAALGDAHVDQICSALADAVETWSPVRADDRSLVVVRRMPEATAQAA